MIDPIYTSEQRLINLGFQQQLNNKHYRKIIETKAGKGFINAIINRHLMIDIYWELHNGFGNMVCSEKCDRIIDIIKEIEAIGNK